MEAAEQDKARAETERDKERESLYPQSERMTADRKREQAQLEEDRKKEERFLREKEKERERVAAEMRKQFELQQKLIEEKQKLALLEKQKELEQLPKEQHRQLFEAVRFEDSNPSRSVVDVRAMTVSPEHDSPSPLDSSGHDSPPPRVKLKRDFVRQ